MKKIKNTYLKNAILGFVLGFCLSVTVFPALAAYVESP